MHDEASAQRLEDALAARVSRGPSLAENGDWDLRERIEARSRFVWDDGGPVCMLGCGRQTRNGISIAPVYTPPEKRARGYATAATAALSQQLLDEGRSFCALFADLDNPISTGMYQRIGYRRLGDFAEYEFRA